MEPNDKPPVSILMVTDKNKAIVDYAMTDMDNYILKLDKSYPLNLKTVLIDLGFHLNFFLLLIIQPPYLYIL